MALLDPATSNRVLCQGSPQALLKAEDWTIIGGDRPVGCL